MRKVAIICELGLFSQQAILFLFENNYSFIQPEK